MVKKSIDNITQQTRTLLAIRANKNAYSQVLVLVRFISTSCFEICLESKQLFPVLLYFRQHSGTGLFLNGSPFTSLDIRIQKYVKESKIKWSGIFVVGSFVYSTYLLFYHSQLSPVRSFGTA